MAGKKIDFQRGIRNLVRIRYPEINLIPEGIEFLAKLLSGVNDQLLKNFGAEGKSKNSFQICAKNAIEKTFKGDLKQYGIAEAQRQYGLLKMGCMMYEKESDIQEPSPIKSAKLRGLRGKPRPKRKQLQSATEAPTGEKSKSPPSKAMAPPTDASKKMFISGISKLCTPNNPMEEKAKAFLSNHLYILASRIANKAAQNAGDKNEIQPKHVKQALTDSMGPETLRTADGEASRCLSLFKSGQINFQPKVTTKKLSKPGSSKATDVDKTTKPTKGKEEIRLLMDGDIFKSGLRGFLEEFSKDGRIDQDSLKKMQDILAKIAEAIASQAANKCERSGATQMGSAELRDAVGEVFLNNELRHHALVEGTKYVAHFANGMVRYEPEQPKHGKILKSSKGYKTPAKKYVRISKKRQIPQALVKGEKTAKIGAKGKRVTKKPKLKSLPRKQVLAARKKLPKQKGQPRKKVLASKRAPRQKRLPGKKVIVSKKRAPVKRKKIPAKISAVVKRMKKKLPATRQKPTVRKKIAAKKRFSVKKLLSVKKKRPIIKKAQEKRKRMPSKVKAKDKHIKKLPTQKGLSVKKVFVSKKRVPVKGKRTPVKRKKIQAKLSALKRIKKKVPPTEKKQAVSRRATKKPAKKVKLPMKKLPSTKQKRPITKRPPKKRKPTGKKQVVSRRTTKRPAKKIKLPVKKLPSPKQKRPITKRTPKKRKSTGKKQVVSRRTKKPAKKIKLPMKKLPSAKQERLITKRAREKRKRIYKQLAKKKHLEKKISAKKKQVAALRDVSKSRKRKRSRKKKLPTGKQRLISRPTSKVKKTRAVKPSLIKKTIPSVPSLKKAAMKRKRSPAKSSARVKRFKKKVPVARKKRVVSPPPVTKKSGKPTSRSFAKKTRPSKLLKKQKPLPKEKPLPEKRRTEPAQELVTVPHRAPPSQKKPKKSPIPKKSILKRKVDFASGLNDIVIFAFPDAKVKLPQEVATEISKILGDIAAMLAVKSAEDAQKRGGRVLGADNVRNAALNFLSEELGQHAISRGENVTMSNTQ